MTTSRTSTPIRRSASTSRWSGTSRLGRPRRHRVGRDPGARPRGLGGGLHRPGRRHRRPGHRLRLGPSRAQEQVPRLERHRRRPQLQLARRHPRRRRRAAAPTRPSPATTSATARTPWAPWWATTARATRSAWPRARGGSAAATWTRATARRPPTASASSGSSRPPTWPTRTRTRPGAARHQQLLGLPAQRGLHEPQRAAHGGREHARGGHRGGRLRRQQRLRLQHRDRPAGDLRRLVQRGLDDDRAPTTIAGFSSRGPVTVDGSNRLKPNISAPGSDVRSSVPGGGYATSAAPAWPARTSRAWSGCSSPPSRAARQVGDRERLMTTAVPRTTTQTCGGVPGTQIPNNTYGYGRVDAWDASARAAPTSRCRRRLAGRDPHRRRAHLHDDVTNPVR